MWLLGVFVISLFSQTNGSPIRLSGNPSGSACLAVFILVALALTVLTILKHIFMRHRRMSALNLDPTSDTSTQFDSSYNTSRSSASFLPSKNSFTSEKTGNRGFWVGFFGSPRWETRYDIEKGMGHTRRFYRLCEQSKLSSRSRRSSALSKGSVVSVGNSGLPMSSIVESRALYSIRDGTNRSRSLRLPYPAKVYVKPSRTPRRFSAPADSRSTRTGSLTKKRYNSLKSSRSRRSDLSGSIYGNASLRLVDSTFHQEPPLPLSPKLRRVPSNATRNGCPSPKQNGYAGIYTAMASCFPPSSTSPKGPLPGLPDLPPTQFHQFTTGLPMPTISHPYALMPATKDPKRLSRGPSGLGATSQLPPKRHQPSRAGSSTKASVYEIPALLQQQPSVLGFPVVPGFSRQPQKPRVVTPRTRKSPVIGPSPLRVMTLPENSCSSQLSVKDSNAKHEATASLRDSTVSLSKADDDETALMGIIQELIEEASDWDSSLFMEPSFKSLLADSCMKNGSTVGLGLDEPANLSNGTSSGQDTSSGSSNHSGSEEMDLSLLGVEVSRTGTQTTHPQVERQRDERNGSGFVSFWDDKGWENPTAPHHCVESVGLAV